MNGYRSSSLIEVPSDLRGKLFNSRKCRRSLCEFLSNEMIGLAPSRFIIRYHYQGKMLKTLTGLLHVQCPFCMCTCTSAHVGFLSQVVCALCCDPVEEMYPCRQAPGCHPDHHVSKKEIISH